MGDPGPPPEKYGETWEASREATGLKLIPELCKGVRWQTVLKDESRRSFAAYLPSQVSTSKLERFFNDIRDGTAWFQPTGPLGLVPRKTAWVVAPGCRCTYRYGGIGVEPQEFPRWMVEIMELYMPYCGLPERGDWPNSCNVNLYENGSHSVGWHSDDEVLFNGKHQDIRILSLSLGQTRKFDLKKNWPEEGERDADRLMLGNGCLMTMEGMMQKHYQHRVPKDRENIGPRINLTWRWIVCHSKGCACY